MLDGLSSHYEPESVEFVREEDMILFGLPPHTTQDTQPLDCTVFGPLKRHWTEVCHDFQEENLGVAMSKLIFSALYAKAWLQALTPVNIVVGFKKCGIHPLYKEAIPVPDLNNSGSTDTTQHSSHVIQDVVLRLKTAQLGRKSCIRRGTRRDLTYTILTITLA